MTNRKFSSKELAMVTELNLELASWLGIKRIICIGQDAASYANSFGIEVACVRHPSYGGTKDFRDGMQTIYGKKLRPASSQSELF